MVIEMGQYKKNLKKSKPNNISQSKSNIICQTNASTTTGAF